MSQLCRGSTHYIITYCIILVYWLLCLLVFKIMFTCIQDHVYLYSRSCLLVFKIMFTCIQDHVYLYSRSCLLVFKIMFTCIQDHVYLYYIKSIDHVQDHGLLSVLIHVLNVYFYCSKELVYLYIKYIVKSTCRF